jgi:hypothetical protein
MIERKLKIYKAAAVAIYLYGIEVTEALVIEK